MLLIIFGSCSLNSQPCPAALVIIVRPQGALLLIQQSAHSLLAIAVRSKVLSPLANFTKARDFPAIKPRYSWLFFPIRSYHTSLAVFQLLSRPKRRLLWVFSLAIFSAN